MSIDVFLALFDELSLEFNVPFIMTGGEEFWVSKALSLGVDSATAWFLDLSSKTRVIASRKHKKL